MNERLLCVGPSLVPALKENCEIYGTLGSLPSGTSQALCEPCFKTLYPSVEDIKSSPLFQSNDRKDEI